MKTSSTRARIAVISLQAALLTTWLVLAATKGFYEYLGIAGLSWMLVLTGLWAGFSWWIIRNELFGPYPLFLIIAFAFSGGHAVLELLGANKRGFLFEEFTVETTLDTIVLVGISFAALHFGALLALRPPRPTTSIRGSVVCLHHVRQIGWTLIIVSIPAATFVTVNSLTSVFREGYFALFEERGPVGLMAAPTILAPFFVTGLLMLLAGSAHRRKTRWTIMIIGFLYAGLLLFAGSRGAAARVLLAFGWVRHRTVQPIPTSVLLGVGLATALLVFPIIGMTRSIPGDERLSLEYYVQAYASADNPAAQSLAEIGGTMRTVAWTLELVPDSRPYEFGVEYGYALLSVLPNLGWKLHPSAEHAKPSMWITREVQPATFARGGSLGYSFIAEAYLNFGFLGVPFIMLLLGAGIVRLEIWSERGPPALIAARTAALASFFSFLFVFPRSEAVTVIRGFVWYFVVPYAAILLTAYIAYLYRRPGMRRDLVSG